MANLMVLNDSTIDGVEVVTHFEALAPLILLSDPYLVGAQVLLIDIFEYGLWILLKIH